MIGLSEDTRARERAGVTPEGRVQGWKTYETRFGMPVLEHAAHPPDRVGAGLPGGQGGRARWDAGERMLRALRLAWFTTTLLLDTDDGDRRGGRDGGP